MSPAAYADRSATRLAEAVAASFPGTPIRTEWFPTIGSTHVEARRRLAAGEPPGFLLSADHQSAGVGRRGGRWEAPPGTSLMFTLALPAPKEANGLAPSLVAALSVAEGLDDVLPTPATIKWPNDVRLEGRKLCGVLAELATGRGGAALLVSAGVNATQTVEQLPPPAEGVVATSIALERARAGAKPWEMDERFDLLASILARLFANLAAPPERPLLALALRCSTLGRRARVEREGLPVLEGRAEKLDPSGALFVRDAATGQLERCLSGHLRELD